MMTYNQARTTASIYNVSHVDEIREGSIVPKTPADVLAETDEDTFNQYAAIAKAYNQERVSGRKMTVTDVMYQQSLRHHKNTATESAYAEAGTTAKTHNDNVVFGEHLCAEDILERHQCMHKRVDELARCGGSEGVLKPGSDESVSKGDSDINDVSDDIIHTTSLSVIHPHRGVILEHIRSDLALVMGPEMAATLTSRLM